MTKYFLKVGAVSLSMVLAGLGVAEAATVNIFRVNGAPHETVYGIRDNTGTDGIDLEGAMITANYADGTSENIVWEALLTYHDDGGGYYSIDGEADGEHTYLYMNWDGFEMTTTSLLTSLFIDLAPASSVFDTTYIFDNDPSGGSTLSSSFGYEFEFYTEYENLPGDVTVTYSGIVNLTGAPAVGDLYTTMLVDFSGLSPDGGILGDLNFRSDMDTMRYTDDLVSVQGPSPVPLPASLPLLLIGVAGLGLARRAAILQR